MRWWYYVLMPKIKHKLIFDVDARCRPRILVVVGLMAVDVPYSGGFDNCRSTYAQLINVGFLLPVGFRGGRYGSMGNSFKHKSRSSGNNGQFLAISQYKKYVINYVRCQCFSHVCYKIKSIYQSKSYFYVTIDK